MKAVILAGGEGTRLRPLTLITPKAMMPVLNIPFIRYMIDHLHKYGINEIILSMGYKPDPIKSYMSKIQADVKLEYSIEDRPLGTAGAVKLAQPFLKNEDAFFVINGDVFTLINLNEMLRLHQLRRASVTIALTSMEDPSHFGVVEIDQQQRIQRFVEKPGKEEAPSNYINAGIYLIKNDILREIPENKYYMFEYDLFPKLLSAGVPIFGYVFEDYWIDMGNPHKYMQLNTDLITGRCKQDICIPETVNTGMDCRIHRQTKLIGALLIGQHSNLEQEVTINGPCIIGEHCIIQSNSSLSNSILWNHVSIGKNTKIKNSIIANNCIIPDNSLIENDIICPEN